MQSTFMRFPALADSSHPQFPFHPTDNKNQYKKMAQSHEIFV